MFLCVGINWIIYTKCLCDSTLDFGSLEANWRNLQIGNLKCKSKYVVSWFDLWNYIVELWCLLWQHVYVYKGLNMDM